MEMRLFRNIIDQCAEAGCVRKLVIQGFGEPLLDPNFCEKISYAKERKIPIVYTVTNGSLLTSEISEQIVKSGLDKMKVSFYGITRREYERIHKGLDFEVVRKNIVQLLEIKKRLLSNKPKLRIQYIGNKRKFFKFALQWIFRTSIGFSRFHNYGNGRNYVKVRVSKENRQCKIVKKPIMQILWNGDVVPCCYDFDGKIILGNLARATIHDVWNGRNYTNFRIAHRTCKLQNFPLCLLCDKLR